MACFLDRPLTPDATEAVSNHCSFEQMRNNAMVNRVAHCYTDIFDLTQSKFMRKGVIGDWKNYFTEEQNRAFNKLYNKKMQGSGLELIFEPEEIDTRKNDEGEVTTIKLEN
ncbi:Sulfotransferase family cytosolic 1B member 1 [Araneus ventricosus]|uniref:Sulfotransferase family cytosolic 1B member 1 n=1 Tax=Araneus ventricosus TaxID=182803 RepID=A0A4Y2JDJ1_ARAVE|nr:Sulfotransferase family cytosolic 1B member 1 [Araneus ventricosus]